MGAWGPGPFENDGASDWLGMLEDSGQSPENHVRQTLVDVVANGGYLDVDFGQHMVAAAAITAAQLPSAPSLTMLTVPPAFAALTFTADDDLRRLAVEGLDRIMRPDSELAELWEHDDTFAAAIDQIRRALVLPSQ
jgi:hypothetical protein